MDHDHEHGMGDEGGMGGMGHMMAMSVSIVTNLSLFLPFFKMNFD